MQVRISGDLESFVRQLVADGDYASADQVVAKALAEFARAQIRKDIELGLKSLREGRASVWDVNEAKANLLRRFKRKKKAS